MVYLSLARPTRRDVQQAVERSSERGFNYPPQLRGMTRAEPDSTKPAPGFVVDHTRVRVGTGPADFEAVKAYLQRWGHFQLGWASVDPSTSTKAGTNVCVCARTLVLWSRNPLQVVYDTRGATRAARKRFAFAHGTLHGHMLAGEERFAVELASDGSVYYDIYAVSKPGTLLALLAYPVARLQQKAFAAQSMAAVKAHIRQRTR